MKKFLAIILVLVTALSIVGCKQAAADFSKLDLKVNGFGENLVNKCEFGIKPETTELNADAIKSQLEFFRIDPNDLKVVDDKPEFFYATTGNQSADFVTIIGAKDVDTAKKLSENEIKNWIANLNETAGYNEKEAPKLEKCINYVAGRYVFVICSNDSEASQKVLDELLNDALKLQDAK